MPEDLQLQESTGTNAAIGSQWGDEGKGKIIDEVSKPGTLDARYGGGGNAGHTVVRKYTGPGGEEIVEEHKFNLVPAGILEGAIGVLTEGAVIDPLYLAQEIQSHRAQGVDITSANLLISGNAQAVMPWHIARDRLREEALGINKIGTTLNGIGDTYADKTRRAGLTIARVLGKDIPAIVDAEIGRQERILREIAGEPFLSDLARKEYDGQTLEQVRDLAQKALREHQALDRRAIIEQLEAARDILGPLVTDTLAFVWQAHHDGKAIWLEGAQGALLDVDLGTIPFVTSSNTGLAGITKSTGIDPRELNQVVAVTKAYATRVGGGPLPTELQEGDPIGDQITEDGHEYGTRTGRRRRSGWFDGPATRFGIHRIAFANVVALMKLDVLDRQPELKICVGYRINGTEYKDTPRVDAATLYQVEPMYETLPGWMESTKGITDYNKLPPKARAYIERLQDLLDLPIKIISTGPVRGETIYRR